MNARVPESARQSGRPSPRLLVPWAAMLLSSLALAGLGRLAVPAEAAGPLGAAPALATVVTLLALTCAVAVLLLDRVLLAPGRIARRLPAPDRSLALRHLFAGHLVLWSLAQLPAILGFAQLLLGGALRTHLALCALSLGLLALLMPTRSRITTRVEAALR